MALPTSSEARLHNSLPLPGGIAEIEGLQQMRCIAVVLVAWFHSALQVAPHTSFVIPHPGVFGIDLFFVISGFIISASVERLGGSRWQKARKFVRRRAIRIYPIFWIIALCGFAIALHQHQPMSWKSSSAFFLAPPLTYPSFTTLVPGQWTLIFEVFFYSLIAVCILLWPRKPILSAVVVLAFLPLLGLFLNLHRPVIVVLFNPILWEFVFGAAVAMLYRGKLAAARRYGWGMLVLGALLATAFRYSDLNVADGPQTIFTAVHVFERVSTFGIAAALIIGGTIIGNLRIPSAVGRLMTVLGNASYSIYLLEAFVLVYTFRVIFAHGRFAQTDSPLLALALTASGVAMQCTFGWLCYQFIEWPLTRYLQRAISS